MKYNNATIERYEYLQEQIKLQTKELEEMKRQFIASNGGESEDYSIVLKDNFRENVASKSVFESRLGASWLKDNGLLNLIAYSTVIISRKIGVSHVASSK